MIVTDSGSAPSPVGALQTPKVEDKFNLSKKECIEEW